MPSLRIESTDSMKIIIYRHMVWTNVQSGYDFTIAMGLYSIEGFRKTIGQLANSLVHSVKCKNPFLKRIPDSCFSIVAFLRDKIKM